MNQQTSLNQTPRRMILTQQALEEQSARIFKVGSMDVDTIRTRPDIQSIQMPKLTNGSYSPEKHDIESSYTPTEAGSADFWEQDLIVDDFGGQLKIKKSRTSTYSFTLQIINTTFIFGSLVLPYFLYTVGIVLGTILFFAFFGLSYFSSSILLELKLFSRSKTRQNTLQSIFLTLGFSHRTICIFRTIFVINSVLYLVLLFSLIGLGIQGTLNILGLNGSFYYSQPFIIAIGGIIVAPFTLSQTQPSYLLATARIFGWASIMLLVVISLIIDTNPITVETLFPPEDFSYLTFLTTLPTLVLSFAYHQQFFTGQIEEDVSKIKAGSLQGSLLIMVVELIFSIVGQVAFYSNFNVQYDNLISITVISDVIPNTLKVYFLTTTGISALLQVFQYVPQSVVQVQNVIDYLFGSPLEEVNFQLIVEAGTLDSIKSDKQQKAPKRFRSWIPLTLITIAVLLAMLVPPLLLPIVIMGAITQNSLSFLLPSFLYIIWGSLDKTKSEIEPKGYKIYFSCFILIFSLLFGFVTLIAAVIEFNIYQQPIQ